MDLLIQVIESSYKQTVGTRSFFFYNIRNHKYILTKYCNHQEHAYFYLGGYKNTMLKQKLPEQITKIKTLKEKGRLKVNIIIK